MFVLIYDLNAYICLNYTSQSVGKQHNKKKVSQGDIQKYEFLNKNINMTSDDIQRRLGENVKRIRKEQKLTQFQLAEKADLSEETVKNIELSRCWTSDKNLAKLTKALGVDIHCLFLPVDSSFNEDSSETIIIKDAIAKNLRDYVAKVLKEI